MTSDTDALSSNRPYAPPSNITTILQRLRNRNLPSKIDAEFLRDLQISQGTIGRALFALRFLRLTEEDDTPSSVLRSIATSTDEEYQGMLDGLLREAYGDVFETLDPTEDTQDKFANFFRRYTPASQRERMVIFFLGMCREAGMQLADAPRQRTTQTKARNAASTSTAREKPGPKTRAYRSTSRSGADAETQDTVGIPPALLLLVRSLPPQGSVFPPDRRKHWLDMAAATLTYVYSETASDVRAEDIDDDNGDDDAGAELQE